MELVRRLSLLAILSACLLASSGLVLAKPFDARATTILVTLKEGVSPADIASDHGLVVAGGFPAADTYVVLAKDLRALRGDARVETTEADGRVRAQTASWDTASWNTASWDRASWDTASWDRASWDTASWDRASWDTASWDRASWDTASWDRASWDRASWDRSNDTSEPLELVWGLAAIAAPRAWSLGVPEGTRTVCMVDSGIDASHPRLAPRVIAGRDLVRGDAVPDDEGGHGTHLAGIIAGLPGQDPFRGVGAPRIAAVKVLDETGMGTTSDVISGIAWCSDAGADIILLALSEDVPTRALARAVKASQEEGILIVASAGNAGPCSRCESYPAAYPGVLGVAAATPDGTLAPFSSTGPRVSLGAPGVAIASTLPGGSYGVGSGTSQAAAFAAGAAALVWAQQPSLSAREVQGILERSAFEPGVRGEGLGFGLLDVGAASALARGR